MPSAIPCNRLLFTFRVHSCLFSDWRRTVLSKFFDIQLPSVCTEELVLPRHACCVLSRLRCSGHNLLFSSFLLNWQNRESFMQRLQSSVPCYLISFCTAQLWTLLRSLFGDSRSLYDLWSRLRVVAGLLGLHSLPPCSHPLEGTGKQQTFVTGYCSPGFLVN